ncbi:hypothetical protein B0T17DRAFT_510074 [Bombardia bombarda]|uniref:Uncharacterized protein n=1 Tax=Bombardia bombarda TaxID=252184 RepID=A0AA40BYH2_9PEZI|nr:hypothetical protein B0T17DRAFT_510074 [Bombardia bombarda]
MVYKQTTAAARGRRWLGRRKAESGKLMGEWMGWDGMGWDGRARIELSMDGKDGGVRQGSGSTIRRSGTDRRVWVLWETSMDDGPLSSSSWSSSSPSSAAFPPLSVFFFPPCPPSTTPGCLRSLLYPVRPTALRHRTAPCTGGRLAPRGTFLIDQGADRLRAGVGARGHAWDSQSHPAEPHLTPGHRTRGMQHSSHNRATTGAISDAPSLVYVQLWCFGATSKP